MKKMHGTHLADMSSMTLNDKDRTNAGSIQRTIPDSEAYINFVNFLSKNHSTSDDVQFNTGIITTLGKLCNCPTYLASDFLFLQNTLILEILYSHVMIVVPICGIKREQTSTDIVQIQISIFVVVVERFNYLF